MKFKEYMNEKKSIELRKLKGMVYDKLKDMGFKVSMTDTTHLTFFTDKPINKKSGKHGNQYITSFGEVAARKFLEE